MMMIRWSMKITLTMRGGAQRNRKRETMGGNTERITKKGGRKIEISVEAEKEKLYQCKGRKRDGGHPTKDTTEGLSECE